MDAPPHSIIAITGASGVVGKRLSADLRTAGHRVYELRRAAGPTTTPADSTWNPATGQITAPQPFDTLVHLAGKNIATRWTKKARQEIWDSRIPATEKLCHFLAQLPLETRPKLLISASAIGIYGNRDDEVLTEDSPIAPQGKTFMGDLCRAWETAATPALNAGIRVIHPRIGIVLSKDGGALKKMLTPTKLFLGGPVGKGTQWMPCISNTDLCRLLAFLATKPGNLAGPINAVVPNPIRQHQFIRTLGHIVHRPTVFPLPSFMVKLIFGQLGTEALLSSYRVIPTRLPQEFQFQHPTLESAIIAELK